MVGGCLNFYLFIYFYNKKSQDLVKQHNPLEERLFWRDKDSETEFKFFIHWVH